jgi:hypothetical protein
VLLPWRTRAYEIEVFDTDDRDRIIRRHGDFIIKLSHITGRNDDTVWNFLVINSVKSILLVEIIWSHDTGAVVPSSHTRVWIWK